MLSKVLLLLPALVSLLVALAACLPWGAPIPVEFALPLMTMAVIYYWSVHRSDLVPSPFVFGIGLFTDLATSGPLGYWALNLLIAVAVANYGIDRIADRRDAFAVMAGFALTVTVVSSIGWLLSSLFFLRTMPVRPVLLGAIIAITAYPLVTYLLGPLDRAIGHVLHARGLAKDDFA